MTDDQFVPVPMKVVSENQAHESEEIIGVYNDMMTETDGHAPVQDNPFQGWDSTAIDMAGVAVGQVLIEASDDLEDAVCAGVSLGIRLGLYLWECEPDHAS